MNPEITLTKEKKILLGDILVDELRFLKFELELPVDDTSVVELIELCEACGVNPDWETLEEESV